MKNQSAGNRRLLCWMMPGIFFFLVPALHALGQEPGNSAPGQPAAHQAGKIQTLLDPFFAGRVGQGNIPGAVFVLVSDGQVLLVRGYGYADLEKKRPVDPKSTIFRAGSISKLFTATAVMQLYEQKRLKLDENVNAYLKHFKLQDTFPQPVTLAHLMTHTGGFAEYIHGQHMLDESRWQPLAEYLARRMPPRIMPPGKLFSYNDHGMSLAGLIVEEVSGIPFAAYVEKNIFQPLGMGKSTFNQRPDPSLMDDLALGYAYKNGNNVPYQLDYIQTVPAAGLYTTAHDVSRFMIAQLQYGLFGQTRILNEATAREMQARHFIHHPKLRGRAYGFSELFINGQRLIFHDGGMPGFTSRLCLLPESGLGFFVSYTSDKLSLKSDLTTTLMDYLFAPEAKPAPTAVTTVPGNMEAFAGCYDQIAGFAPNALRLGSMLENFVDVKPAGNNALAIFGGEYKEIDPLLFQDKDGYCVAFGTDDNQNVRYLYVGSGAYEKLNLMETPNALLCQIGLVTLVSLPMGVIWPLGILLRPGTFRASWRRFFPSGRFLAGIVSLLIVFFLASFVGLFLQIDHYWQIMRNEFPWPWLTRLLIVPIIISALVPPLLYYSAMGWMKKQGTAFGRSYLSLVAAATLFFLWILRQWNLIGFNY